MIPPAAVRVMRYAGAALFVASIGMFGAVVLIEVVRGPAAEWTILPDVRLARYFRNSVVIATCACAFALLLALPATIALAQAPRGCERSVLYALAAMPLVTMPSIYGYAWVLMTTPHGRLFARTLRFVGLDRPEMQFVLAAAVLAAWLWPIPALVLSGAFVRLGRQSYQVARLDAGAVRAFVRGALPVMRGPLTAAMAIVFVLAVTDTVIGPLLFVNETWSVEMRAEAAAAADVDRTVGYLVWRSWPMLALVAAAAAAAVPGLRRMRDWAAVEDDGATGSHAAGSSWTFAIATIVTAVVVLSPIVVFVTELAGSRGRVREAVRTAATIYGKDGLATLLVAGLSALACGLVATAVMGAASRSSGRRTTVPGYGRRVIRQTVVIACIAGALMPPELTGWTLAAIWSSIGDASRWNLYDDTPWTWIAAMIVRFAFLPVCVVALLGRQVGGELDDQARSDGADRGQRLAYVRLPLLARPLLGAAVIAGCLTMSDVATSGMVQPPRFFGRSLAVRVDSEMHYGRHHVTTATSLAMIVPAALAAGAVPLLTRRRARRNHGAR